MTPEEKRALRKLRRASLKSERRYERGKIPEDWEAVRDQIRKEKEGKGNSRPGPQLHSGPYRHALHSTKRRNGFST